MNDRQTKRKKQAITIIHAATSSTGQASGPSPKMPGFCDICQMGDRFKDMTLLQCQDCGVLVHDRCYGIDESYYGRPSATLQFTCWACLAVGTKVKVRDRNPRTQERCVVAQTYRPVECCLCSIDDGRHAMHPVYDSHGTRGRQILLPPHERTGHRRLAWCHTLCAVTVNQIRPTQGCFYSCTSRGVYDLNDPIEYVSDTESVNSDLVHGEEEQGVGGVTSGNNQHHFVYWGHYDRMRGREVDAWGKKYYEAKSNKLRCVFCGKDDDKRIHLNGQEMFASLRIPLQCTAKNRDEFAEFRKYHRGLEPCYQAIHAGCAMWGRNEDGEYSMVRRHYFFPGLQHATLKKERNPVVECYCDLHAQDVFLPRAEAGGSHSIMEKRLPGPFAALTGPAKKKFKKWKKQKAGPPRVAEVAVSKSTEAAKNVTALKQVRTIGKPIVPGYGAVARRTSGTSNTSTTMVRKSSTKRPPNTAITLHGETRKKKARELNQAGDAVAIQTEKHGRLVSSRRPSASETNAAMDSQGGKTTQLVFAQRLLDDLTKAKEKCTKAGKTFFDSTVTAPLRIQWLNRSAKEGISKEDFKSSWKEALEYLKDCRDMCKVPRKRKDSERALESVPNSNNSDNAVFEDVNLDQEDNLEVFPPRKKAKFSSNSVLSEKWNQGQYSGSTSTNTEFDSHGSYQAGTTKRIQIPQPFSEEWNNLLHEMAVDIVGNVEPYSGSEQREEVARNIVRQRRQAWKKRVDFSGSDSSLFLASLKEEVKRRCPWLEIEETRSSPVRAKRDLDKTQSTYSRQKEDAGDPKNTLLCDLPDRQSPEVEMVEEETEMVQRNVPQQSVLRAPLNQPNRWSHLSYGPYRKRIGLTLEWETFEEVSPQD